MPQFDDARVAVFTQNTESVVDGHQVEDGIITHTLWGELRDHGVGSTDHFLR